MAAAIDALVHEAIACDAAVVVVSAIATVTWERAPCVRNRVAPVDEARLERAVLAVESLSAGR